MSSLDPKDAIADYSSLTEAQVKTLDQWEAFFQKASQQVIAIGCTDQQRYNIVGQVTK
jgi:hypothetical protein